jgi:hypothetical protein
MKFSRKKPLDDDKSRKDRQDAMDAYFREHGGNVKRSGVAIFRERWAIKGWEGVGLSLIAGKPLPLGLSYFSV